MKKLAMLATIMGLMGVLGSAYGAELKVGDQAPDFELQGTDGKTYKLSDLRGQTVVVAWYPKADTPGCTRECQSMTRSGEKIREFNVAYFAASVDDVKANQAFAQKYNLDFTLLSDPTKQVATAYGVLNPARNVAQRWTFYIGPDGKIQAIDKSVKTESHGDDIAAKLKELGVPKKS